MKLKARAEDLAARLPLVKRIRQERDRLKAELDYVNRFVPPGHFYSPIPSLEEVRQNEERIFGLPQNIPAIDLNEAEQLRLFHIFKEFYREIPFHQEKTDGLRYYFENPHYSYSDAICLYSMIRYLRPRKIIEIGSGHSSCAILDTDELFFAGAIDCTFIEPHTELLLSLIKETDLERIEIVQSKLQDVDISRFAELAGNDILFIDSTHVAKIGSDVNHIFFRILPALKPGVHVHFHDIFYPFEYPKEWVYDGRAWNELYLLRAFLEYNDSVRIVFFNTFMEHFHEESFRESMPLCLKNRGGSIWLRKS
jgi:predicted O-methyltransferase YrrM